MTENHVTGANRIVEVLLCVTNDKAKLWKLPRKVFLQADNCSRENNNGCFISYFDCVIQLGAFDESEVGFLPVVHTHSDIDQCLRTTSCILRSHHAYTFADMHHQLYSCLVVVLKSAECTAVSVSLNFVMHLIAWIMWKNNIIHIVPMQSFYKQARSLVPPLMYFGYCMGFTALRTGRKDNCFLPVLRDR